MVARGVDNSKYQGSKWIRREKRLAIYLRDGMACAWCGMGIEDGIRLTLDHLIPHIHGGSNEATNLVTSCLTCNSSRGDRPIIEFACAVAQYKNHDLTWDSVLDHITDCIERPLDLTAAKLLIERRGSWSAVLTSPSH